MKTSHIVFWAIGLLLLVAIITSEETPEPDEDESPAVATQVETTDSSLDLSKTLEKIPDLSQNQIGQFLASYDSISNEGVNVFFWFIIATLFIVAISTLINAYKSKSVSGLGWALIRIGLVGAVVFVGLSQTEENLTKTATKGTKVKEYKSTPIDVKLQQVGFGVPVTREMSPMDFARVTIPTNRTGDGKTTNFACARIIEPQALLLIKGFPEQHMGFKNKGYSNYLDLVFTKKILLLMMDNNIYRVTVEFTLIQGRDGTNPCPNSGWIPPDS